LEGEVKKIKKTLEFSSREIGLIRLDFGKILNMELLEIEKELGRAIIEYAAGTEIVPKNPKTEDAGTSGRAQRNTHYRTH
jgi:hypothetical protein